MQEYQDKRTLVGHTLLLRRVGLNVNDVTNSVVDEEGGDVGGTVLYRLQYSPKKARTPQTTPDDVIPANASSISNRQRQSFDCRGVGVDRIIVKKRIKIVSIPPSNCFHNPSLRTLETPPEHVARSRSHTERVRHLDGLLNGSQKENRLASKKSIPFGF